MLAAYAKFIREKYTMIIISTLALATVFFSPITILVPAIKPVIQIAFMVAFLRLSPRLNQKF
ncbi:MAG: hypothetical protein JW882_05315 [Deltaproteobacteria bacterium]|nr:hypothetical protein [Deltaproteobacteria bacterium]